MIFGNTANPQICQYLGSSGEWKKSRKLCRYDMGNEMQYALNKNGGITERNEKGVSPKMDSNLWPYMKLSSLTENIGYSFVS